MARSGRRLLVLCVGVVVGGLLSACSSSSSPSATPSGSTTTGGTAPTLSAKQEAGIALTQLLAAQDAATNANPLRGSPTFEEWHRAVAAIADACHAVVEGLGSGTWPAEAQAAISEFRDAQAASCRYGDKLAHARTLNELRSLPGVPKAQRERLTAAKLAAYTALGI